MNNFGKVISTFSKYAVSFNLVQLKLKKIFKNYMHQHYMTIWPRPKVKNPTLRDMKFTTLEEGFSDLSY